jgi:hypothetical protein
LSVVLNNLETYEPKVLQTSITGIIPICSYRSVDLESRQIL